MVRILSILCFLCLVLPSLAQQPQAARQGDNERYHSVGLTDGQGQTTSVHAFNPSATESIHLTFTAYHPDGSLQTVLPENSGALSPMLVNQVLVDLPPLATYAMETQNVGPGRDIGSIEVDASGEVALWHRKQSRKYTAPTDHQTQAFVKESDMSGEYAFPLAVSGTSDRLPNAAALGLVPEPIGTSVYAKNTSAFTALIRVHVRDALLGTDLGSFDLETLPHGTTGRELVSAVPNLLTGNVSLQAELIGGDAFPFVGFRRGIENLDYVGKAMDPDGLPPAQEMPFFHHGNQELEGFIALNNPINQSNYNGMASLTLAPDQALSQQPFAASAGTNVFMGTASFLDDPLARNNGWLELSTQTGFVNGISILSAGETRGLVQPLQPMAQRASFPFDGSQPWEIVYNESYLMVKRLSPGMGLINAILLDADSHILDIVPLEVFQGVTQIPATNLLDMDRDVRTVLLEVEGNDKQPTYAGFFAFGRDPGLDIHLLDVVPIQNLSGSPVVARLGNIYEAWESTLGSCLGSELNISDVVNFINDPSTCN